jgi:hypothetical protein
MAGFGIWGRDIARQKRKHDIEIVVDRLVLPQTDTDLEMRQADRFQAR